MTELRKKNYYLKVLAVQEVYQEQKKDGITNRYVYENFIKDRFFISDRTMRDYLGVNAKKALSNIKKLEQCEQSE